MFLAKKWGILIKKESESLVFTGLEIPRDKIIKEDTYNGNVLRWSISNVKQLCDDGLRRNDVCERSHRGRHSIDILT